jgi:hypothetical protein
LVYCGLRDDRSSKHVLEDTLDPRADPILLARRLAERIDAASVSFSLEDWLGFWNDQSSDWTNLKNLEHWLDRAAR